METMSRTEARRAIVNAQLGRSASNALGVLRNERLIQLDGISRVEKSHRLACAARLDTTSRTAETDEHLWSGSQAVSFETYTHAACLFPIEDWPLLAPLRQKARARRDAPDSEAMDAVLATVAAHPDGATMAQIGADAHRSTSWGWSAPKRAAEHLVWRGELVCSTRQGGRRVYDLPQRKIPRDILQQAPGREEVLGRLASTALETLGVATADDIASHYNLAAADVMKGIDYTGAAQVQVDGWNEPAYALPSVDTGTHPRTPRLIGPFDNLLRNRTRALRAFMFDYMFEAYKPPKSRIYGAYTIAVLDADSFTGRIDAQRNGKDLFFLKLFPEPAADPGHFAAAARQAGEILSAQFGGELKT